MKVIYTNMLCTRYKIVFSLASKVYSCYTAGRGTHKINLQASEQQRERGDGNDERGRLQR